MGGWKVTVAQKHNLIVTIVFSLAGAMALTGCATEYHGYDSGIDGVLARQIATFEDPLSEDLFQPAENGPAAYLDALDGMRWDGSASSAADLELDRGGIVLYDTAATDSSAKVAVFISSGPRPAVPTDENRTYTGPSQVYTCYTVEADFGSEPMPSPDRVMLDDCPPLLVDLLPDDAAFASADVFDG